MGLLISELLAGANTSATGAPGAARSPEAAGAGTPGADEFASRLAAMLQKLQRNASPDQAAAQRQAFAAITLPAQGPAPEGLAVGMPQTLLSPASTQVLTHGQAPVPVPVAGQTLPPGNGAPAALAAFTLGPTLQAITPANTLPDAASLQAFARAQGLDERAVQWLLGHPPARTAADIHSVDRLFDPFAAAAAPGAVASGWLTADAEALPPTTPPLAIQHAAAMPTDDRRLQVLAEEVIELLRSMLGQMQPTLATTTAAAGSAPGIAAPAGLALGAATAATAGAWLPATVGTEGTMNPRATVAGTSHSALTEATAPGIAAPAGLALGAATAATAGAWLPATVGTEGTMNPRATVAGTSHSALTEAIAPGIAAPAGLAKALGEALAAARSLAALAAPTVAAPPASSTASTTTAPTTPSQAPQQAVADVKQALLQLLAALTQRAAGPADAASLAGKAPSASPAADTPQPLGHQAMVFVRAVAQLQRSQPASAPLPVVMPRPAGPQQPLALEVDLTDAWIGDEFDPLAGHARGARTPQPVADNTPTARVLAQWQHERSSTAAAWPGGSADAASPAADSSPPAQPLPAQAHAALQPVGTADELLRGRPTTNTVQAASAGSDTGGNRPQDPDRGRQLADKMGEAVGQRMLQALERGDWTVKLALKPAHLGHIEVNMRMHSAGLDAQFTASQAQTRDLLADGLQRLRDTLVQMGMDVAQLNVGGDRSQKRGGDSTPRQTAAAKPVAGVQTTEETDAKNQPTTTRLRNAAGWDVMV